MNKKRNLVFMMTDHQRADSLDMVQAGREVTPRLNRLAREGLRFHRTYNACPLCVPARTALATGKYPTRNGIRFNDWSGKTAGDHPTLHELLKQNGYRVAHIGVDHIKVKPPLRERMDFDRWTGNGEHEAYLKQKGVGAPADADDFRCRVMENQEGRQVECRYSNSHSAVWRGDAEDFKDLYWCRDACEFIEEAGDAPFALFLTLWAPHPPLRVPEPYASRFPPQEIDLPENVGTPCEGEPEVYRQGIAAQLAENLSPAEWRRVWAAHLGLVNLADTGMGRILDTLQTSGKRDHTLVVFTSDHGDHLGQHRMYQKMEMYEQAIRVPMIWSGPGVRRGGVRAPVSHLDVLPTLAETLGLPLPADLDGHSFAGALTEGEPATRPVFSQYSGNPTDGDIRRCVIDGPLKYVWNPSGHCELFDLESDPLEQQNLSGSPEWRNQEQRLHDCCRDWAAAHNDDVFSP